MTASALQTPPPESIILKDPVRAHFRSDHYTRINLRRLEHLATLALVRPGMSVLELGAGIGDLTGFFLDRGCTVTLAEGRQDNLEICRQRLRDESRAECVQLDLDDLHRTPLDNRTWDLVFAYGVLYHLRQPAEALRWMAQRCAGAMIVETCVTPDDSLAINPTAEDASFASQALRGTGCRPTRPWVWRQLNTLMPFVYTMKTQPNHDEFPTNWTSPAPSRTGLHRAIFVASRSPLDDHPMLSASLLNRHDPST